MTERNNKFENSTSNMASPLDTITKLLAGLATGNNCRETLENLRVVLGDVSQIELRDYVPKIDINRLFICLSTTDKEQIELTCDILKQLLRCLPHGSALEKYEDLYLEGLSHPEELVKQLILSQLQMDADDPSTADQLASRVEVVLTCVRLIGSDDSSIASLAIKILTSLAKQGDAAIVLLSTPLVEEIQLLGKKNDTVRYRTYELIVNLCLTSAEKLSFTHELGLLNPLIKEVLEGDILVRLNALELVTTLATCLHGRNYIVDHGIIAKFADTLNQASADPFGSLIVPGLVKFYGVFAHFQSSILLENPNITDSLFHLLEDSDLTSQIVAVETIAFISLGKNGRVILSQLDQQMNTACKTIGSLIKNSNSEVRLKALHSVGELLHIQSSEIQDPKLLSIVENWALKLDNHLINFIMNLLKQPFRDIRLESLTILKDLCPQPWAQKLMSKQPGFIEFLLDRGAEPDKDCVERKFQVAEKLVESISDPSDIWTSYTVSKLTEHVRQGPWFVRAQARVAVESGP